MRILTRFRLLVVALLGTALAIASPALASGLHWYQGKTPTITYNSSTQTVTATGEVAGAGTYIDATLATNYRYPVSCYNPGNDSGPVPGQNQTGTSSVSSGPIQTNHGNATFDLTDTINPTAPASACPGSGWTAVAGPVTVTSATLTVTSSNGGSLSYTQTF